MYIIERQYYSYGLRKIEYQIKKISLFEILKIHKIKGTIQLFKNHLCGHNLPKLYLSIGKLIQEQEEIEKEMYNNVVINILK